MIPIILQECLDGNRWEDAIMYINKLEGPLSEDILEKLIWCYSRAGMYQEALEKCDDLIYRQPNKAKWYYFKGYQFYMQKQWQMAVDSFVKAIELYADYFVVKYRLAYAYLQIAGTDKQWSKDVFWKAIKQLEECHKIYASFNSEERHKNSSIYANICALHGKAIMLSEKYLNKSIELIQVAISLQNDNIDFKYQLAKAYYIKKDFDKALSALQGNKRPYYVEELKSQILSEKGDIRGSNKILFDLIRFRRKDYLFQRIAENYLILGRIDKAEEFAKKAVDIGPRNYKNALLYAKILKERGRYKHAIIFFQMARELKQKHFHVDCAEAIQMIEGIQQHGACEPHNLEIKTEQESMNRQKGKITKYNSQKGYGFIKLSNNYEQCFFHVSNFPKGYYPKEGDNVVFNIERTDKGLQANNISLARVQEC